MKKSIIILMIVLLVVGGLIAVALVGIPGVVQPVSKGVVLGLDLAGGSEITYEAIVPEGVSDAELQDGMNDAKTMLQQRLDFLGYTEAKAYISGERRLVVEFPDLEDPEKAVQKLGATAIVTFVDSDGKVWLTGKEDIEKAEYSYGPVDDTGVSRHHVKLKLTKNGQKNLHEASMSIIQKAGEGNNYLAIEMDGEQISAPYVTEELDDDSVVITVNQENAGEEAKYLAEIISAGRLPFELTTAKQQTIGSSLGEKSLSTSLLAGLIGQILVLVIMIVV